MNKSTCVHDPLNYREISILPCLAKLYSRILKNRLTQHCESLEIIADEQNSYRIDRSCVYHISLEFYCKEENEL